jgi:diadenosine tetraphosphate (Ap4A) HIT family hydrolase
VATHKLTCELCMPNDVVAENIHAYARYDSNSLSRGHILVVPRRHVADFFDMNPDEQAAVLALLNHAQKLVQAKYAPNGYNIGVNIGKAAGQSRMHVHLHLIPRYAGDVPDPRGGIRCVLANKNRPA